MGVTAGARSVVYVDGMDVTGITTVDQLADKLTDGTKILKLLGVDNAKLANLLTKALEKASIDAAITERTEVRAGVPNNVASVYAVAAIATKEGYLPDPGFGTLTVKLKDNLKVAVKTITIGLNDPIPADFVTVEPTGTKPVTVYGGVASDVTVNLYVELGTAADQLNEAFAKAGFQTRLTDLLSQGRMAGELKGYLNDERLTKALDELGVDINVTAIQALLKGLEERFPGELDNVPVYLGTPEGKAGIYNVVAVARDTLPAVGAGVLIIKDDTVTITYKVGEGGTVKVEPLDIFEIESATQVKEIVLSQGNAMGATATPSEGYHFVKWTDAADNEVSSDAHYVPVKVDGCFVAATYTAVFERHAWGTWTTDEQTGDHCRACEGSDAKETHAANWSNWAADGETHTHSCQVGGCEVTEIHNANWDNGEVTTAATCSEKGEKTFTCQDCTLTKTEEINVLGHDFAEEFTVDKEATCIEKGSKSKHCSRCEAKTEVTEIPLGNHTWGEWEATTPATATTAGEETRTCSACGATGTRSIPATGGGTTGGGGNTGGTVEIQDPDVTLAGRPMLFTDVGKDAYYYDAVAWAVQQGITSGTSETTFSPNDPCTRAQVVTFLWRSVGSPKTENPVNPFKDVQPEAYYYDAVLWAVEKEITKGTSAEVFSPDNTITRAQTVTFLYRYMA